ncbi:MAG: molybdenum cofactor guanylyltransferase [Gaiellaceae bacterium]
MKPAGLLLTGGTSRRLGRDKASAELGGRSLAVRAAEALASTASPVLAVGHSAGTNLETISDAREGPLAALVAGADALAGRGSRGPLILLAADMPFVSAALLDRLIAALGDADAALPVAEGRDQPLCACYARSAIEVARRLVVEGGRAMFELVDALPAVVRVPEDEWSRIAPPYALLDVDSPEDLAAAERILDAPE